ncbi:MAG: sigma-70 family RNA polymerase sigma factor [Gemmataceae bacterium]|nr:sigma-70 family RNA polymerase sigma factor [Gemmataceae bacterium]
MSWFGSNKTAVEALVDGHYAALYRYAYRLSGATQAAEDLTQEVFLQAQKMLHQLRDPANAKSWLFTILRNAYLHRVRAEKSTRFVSLDGVAEVADRGNAPVPIVDSAQLQAALNQLPEVFRTPVILYYFEDFSYKDIAEQMNVPLGTVMSRLARAKMVLRQSLTEHAEVTTTTAHGEGI